jgi:hypothetical protein
MPPHRGIGLTLDTVSPFWACRGHAPALRTGPEATSAAPQPLQRSTRHGREEGSRRELRPRPMRPRRPARSAPPALRHRSHAEHGRQRHSRPPTVQPTACRLAGIGPRGIRGRVASPAPSAAGSEVASRGSCLRDTNASNAESRPHTSWTARVGGPWGFRLVQHRIWLMGGARARAKRASAMGH